MKPYLHSALRFRAISSAKRILGSVRDSSVSVPYADYTIMPSSRPQQNICDTNGLSARMNGNRPIPPPGVVTQTAHFSPRECVSPRSVPPAAGRCFFQTQKSSRPTLQESSTARSLSPYLPPNHPNHLRASVSQQLLSLIVPHLRFLTALFHSRHIFTQNPLHRP